MGMYTELNIGVEFKRDTPKDVIETIQVMLDDGALDGKKIPLTVANHPLFQTDRWGFMLRCSSYYFDGQPCFVYRFDDIANAWFLTVRSNLKNYGDEIKLFLDFIQPWLKTNGFLGYFMYEEDEHPTLIYNEGGLVFRDIQSESISWQDKA